MQLNSFPALSMPQFPHPYEKDTVSTFFIKTEKYSLNKYLLHD